MSTPDLEPLVRLRPLIARAVDSHFESEFDLKLVHASTLDGFDLFQRHRRDTELEADKLAAISSAMFSMAEALADAVEGEELFRCLVESQKGTIFLKRTECAGVPVILTILIDQTASVGQGLFLTKQIGAAIAAST